MVERMYGDYKKGMKNKGKKNEAHEDDDASVNQGVVGDSPEPLSSPLSSSSSSSEHFHHSHHSSHKSSFKKPLLKLDEKFALAMFNGDANPEKIENWIRQVEVYCCVQHINEEEFKVQLDSLRFEGTALIWWERKLQDISKCVNLLSSWSEFKSMTRKQFYPLGYLHKAMMEWKSLRKSKGQIVQSFTEEFRKKSLALNIPLDSYEMLMKYIGALHSYICHTLLLFNPTNLDEVCVQATHLESRGKNGQEENPFKHSKNHFNGKGNGKDKRTVATKKEEGKPSCNHCEKTGHDRKHCWKLHSELRPKKFGGKGKPKTIATIQHDLGSNSCDEERIIAVGMQGKYSFYACSSSLNESHDDDKRRSALFHIRVVSKHRKIDTLFYPGSQVNLISETLVKKFELTTRPHHKPYPLGWVSDKENLNVTKQCQLRFSIASKMIDEVDLDMVALDVCGIVLGSPYMYDWKAIFFQKENKYHLTKDGVEYIIKAHSIKDKSTLFSSSQVKRVINTNKNLVLTIVKGECQDKSDVVNSLDPLHKN
jgi:hypothetical protein